MSKYNTITIFDNGIVELLSSNGKVEKNANELNKLDAVIDNIFEKKPTDSTEKKEYLTIRIYAGGTTGWYTKDKSEKGFRIDTLLLNKTKLNSLVTELLS